MIEFKKADYKSYLEVKSNLRQLYLDAFTKGISAQHISAEEAETYLENLFESGYGILGFSDDQLVAALVAIPLGFDTERPEEVKVKFDDSNSEYIAEVLVDENYRGLGLGKKTMKAYETHLNKDIKHVLLRVWDKNEAAVALYEKSGFKICGTIVQEKLKPNSKETFIMHKNYMVKSY